MRKIFRVDEHGNTKAARDIVFNKKRPGRRHGLFVLHSSLFLRNFVNLGRSGDIVDWFSYRSAPLDATSLGPQGDGYRPGTASLAPDKVARYEAALKVAIAAQKPNVLDRYTEDICRHCAEMIRSHGAIPVFLVPPVLDQAQFVFPSSADPPGAIFSFNSARSYPAFYRASVRIDDSHMNRTGSSEFSRELGRRFADSLRGGEIR